MESRGRAALQQEWVVPQETGDSLQGCRLLPLQRHGHGGHADVDARASGQSAAYERPERMAVSAGDLLESARIPAHSNCPFLN
ncbi:MAG: hypothetical protein DLM70_09235 [Chloroflexi bacterium]|nr:MAG: hypothetical protein DLM70_09235 [Chloroflexota bacterium]